MNTYMSQKNQTEYHKKKYYIIFKYSEKLITI